MQEARNFEFISYGNIHGKLDSPALVGNLPISLLAPDAGVEESRAQTYSSYDLS